MTEGYFKMKFPYMCLGLILIETTTEPAGFDDYIKYTMFNWKEEGMKLFDKVLQLLHTQNHDEKNPKDKLPNIQDRMNEANINKFLKSYMSRSDLTSLMATNHQLELLVVVGQNSPNFEMVNRMVEPMDKTITTLLNVTDVVDSLYQAPESLARALILFCKGCGVLLGVPMLGLEREFSSVKCTGNPNEVKATYTSKILAAERQAKAALYE